MNNLGCFKWVILLYVNVKTATIFIAILSFLQNDEVIDVAEPVCTARVAKGSQELRGFPERRSFSGKPGTDPFRQTRMVDHPSEDSTL